MRKEGNVIILEDDHEVSKPARQTVTVESG